ncbi:MAG: ABC transporter substrate-binding protein [Actinomycetota bacterium]
MNEEQHRAMRKLIASGPRRGMTRRDLLRRMGIGAAGLSMGAWLSACGTPAQNEATEGAEDDGYTTTKATGELDFANWPAYIDKSKGESPTLLQFERKAGIEVNYQEVINDNQSFYGRIREPLAGGDAIDYDIIVVTDWLVAKMASLGYLEELDHSLLGNFEANAGEIYKDPEYDPNNTHSIPWQSGITGIAYNPELTGREITSVEDLFDPAFEGQVGMLSEMRDTFNLVLLGMGVNPQEATMEDVQRAADKLVQQREDGIVRQYYGNDYLQPLANGDLALCIAWSGDVLGQTLDPELGTQFVVPEEGGILWVDNMAIPQNAAHPIDAHKMMDFVYQPKIAAQMTAWINYICPVPAAQDILQGSGGTRQLAQSPLVFPTPDKETRLHHYTNLETDEEEQSNDLFSQVIQG